MPQSVSDYTAILAYLDQDKNRWNAFTEIGTSIVVTYSFLDGDDLPPDNTGFYGADQFESFSEIQREHMRAVVAEAGSVAGVIFVEVDESPAMINMYSGVDGDGGGISASGYADYGRGQLDKTVTSDLVMIYQNFTPGSFTYQVLLHELGHVMGLAHPHEGGLVLENALDHNENTVMTYKWSSDHMETYGAFDIEAMAHLYGDAGAVDGFHTKVKSNGGIVVTASNGADKLIATDEGSKLIGKAGDDKLYGREGVDFLKGGQGRDVLHGGLGADQLMGQHGNDTINGDIGDEFRGGDDTIKGGMGSDLIFGDGGADTIMGQHGKDYLFGGYGADTISGGVGHDEISGDQGFDVLTGNQGHDTFIFTSRDANEWNTITDFTQGQDVIDLTALASIGFHDLQFSQSGSDGRVKIDEFDLWIVLENVTAADLELSDFAFLGGGFDAS